MAGFEDMMGQQGQAQEAGSGGMEQAASPKPTIASASQEMKLSPEQEADVSKFVTMGVELLINEKFMRGAQKMLDSIEPIEEAMAQIGSSIASRIYMEAAKSDQPLDMGIVLVGGVLLMGEIGEFAQAAGKEIGPEAVEDAFYRAADLFRDMLDTRGMIDQDEMMQTYDAMIEQYGEDTFEMIGEKVRNVRGAAAPTPPEGTEQEMV